MPSSSRSYDRGQEDEAPVGASSSAVTSSGPGGPVPRTGAPALPPRPGARGAPRRPPARRSALESRKRRLYTAIAAVVVVVVAAAVLVSASLLGNGKAASAGGKLSPGEYALPAGVLAAVKAVPTAKLLSAASSKANYAVPAEALPARTKLLTTAGKPTIVFVGADYCPYCAAERWPLVMALSKFGSFSHLVGTSSSSSDVYPSTPTFSFYGSSYKSPYLNFVTAELATDKVDPSTGSYQTLQQPTALEQSLLNQWDKPPYTSEQGAIPFVYLAGRYVLIGAQYDASHISGWQMDRAAAYITAGDNSTSLGAEAAAGYLVREICSITHDRPANVCSLAAAGLKH
ncbi:MAG: DUF929 family protein [Acidimicrobiales bacterium]